MTELSVNRGRFVVVNEVSGKLCFVDSHNGRMIASRSTCYRVKLELSRRFPKCVYCVYRLGRLGKE